MLQRSEHGWLKYVSTVCPIGGAVKAEIFQSPENCLTREYQDRVKHLAEAGKKVGPFVFNRIDLYSAVPSNDKFGARFGFLTQHAAFPQIDSPLSPNAEAWNRKQAQSLPLAGDCGDGDYVADYNLDFASERLISVQTNFYEYCHGAPHGMGWGKVENTVLSPTQRPLKAEDLFGADAEWRPKRQKLFWDTLAATGWRPPDGLQESIRQQMDERFIDPASWTLTQDGIQISFGSYEGGCYACTPQPVTVPWRALKPLLSTDAVAP